ncbi:MAG: hypothetical protein IJV17_05485 [Prevotella sp.]|nr:hypothetical protein [Prevotella sp.]
MKTLKKILATVLVSSLLLSCSLEYKAKSRLETYVKSVVADPDFSIEDKEVRWSTDSICIIHYKLRSRNVFGGWELEDEEYVLLRDRSGVLFEMSLNATKYEEISVFIDGWKRV